MKTSEPKWRPEYRIEDLVEQMASESKPRIIDWGPDVGEENIEPWDGQPNE
jgi:hypothetical protein